MSRPRIAVLGAGIMGGSVALFLARRGCDVVLFDAADAPFAHASRWNEGKIHLGYLYAGDASLQTAHHVLPGGLVFGDLVEELTGCSIDDAVADHDDTYLVHANSVVDAETTASYFQRVSDLARSAPHARRYLSDVSRSTVRRLSAAEIKTLADPESVIAGFQVPERSVETGRIADRFVDALRSESRIEQHLGVRVLGATPSARGRWRIDGIRNGEHHESGGFDAVVNALWEGRPAVDATVGLADEPPWSHRYRLCLFVHTRHRVDVPSVVVGTGPFGDVKNYNGRDFYLSWYPTGLIAQGDEVSPPELGTLDADARERVRLGIAAGLGGILPTIDTILGAADQVTVAGGWVYALGKGSLADPASGLHRRDRFGIHHVGTYHSVDTGKYSTAPWLARELVDHIMPR